MSFSFKITDEEFNKLRKIIFDQFGINLTEAKRNLLVGRLQSVLNKYGFKDFESYYNFVISAKDSSALSELVNRISTNFTYFYREEKHFIYFIDNVLPETLSKMAKQNQNDLRLWCAGCATGEEPYTLIIMMLEKLKSQYANYNAGILATDISENALNFAKEGIYPADRLQKIPENFKKYFQKKVDDENEFVISEQIKKEVTFRRFNLMNEKFPFKKPFHTIFCRNVMIYFNEQTKTELVKKFYDQLLPGGYLFIGHSETIGRNQEYFDYVMPAVYKKKE